MNIEFREIILPEVQNSNIRDSKIHTYYVSHDSVEYLPSDRRLKQSATGRDTLAMECVEPIEDYITTDNVILNGSPSRCLLNALELDSRQIPSARIIHNLARTGIVSKLVEPPQDSKLWRLRRKRVLQTEQATDYVMSRGITKKTVATYCKARRLYIKDSMVPRDVAATEAIVRLLGQSARIISFWGSAHMSIALALDRVGIEQTVEVPEYQMLDIEPGAQIIDELRMGTEVESERYTPWLVAEIASRGIRSGIKVESAANGTVTEINPKIIDRIVSMSPADSDFYLEGADESIKKRSTLLIP